MNVEMWNIKEVAQYFRVTEKTIYRLAISGKIPGIKIGGTWRFKKHELENWYHDTSRNK